MGEANRRGNRADRIASALAKIEALWPPYIVCNGCQAQLTDVVALPTRMMAGLDAAFAAHCHSCKSDTYAVKGTPDAVAHFDQAMYEMYGDEAKTGIQSFPLH